MTGADEAPEALDPETLDALLSTIRRFVRDRLVPNEARVAADNAIPDDLR